ncbi:MAG: DUF2490 domain-containing protein [Saprospiraceae bacterium]
MKGRYIKQLLSIVLIIISSVQLFSQDEQYGLWLNYQLDKKLKNWHFELESELRTVYYLQLIERGSIKLTSRYNFTKRLDLSAEYGLINVLDVKYDNYQIRHRFALELGYTLKFGDLKFGIKEKFRLTTKDESKRIDEDGTIDTYRLNPEITWVNGLNFEYNIPKSKISPFGQMSTYYTINDDENSGFENIRYKLGIDYKINKRSNANMYFLYNSHQESDDNYGKYILGFGFRQTLK